MQRVVLAVALTVAVAALVTAAVLVLLKYRDAAAKRIPRVFMRTGPWERDAIPPPARAAMDAALALNPQYTMHYYSDADVTAYIAAHYPQYAALYASIRPGAYRADLWRLLYLYDHGGVYNDAGHTYTVPMSAILDESDEFVSAVEIGYKWALHNAFLAVYPRHALIRAMLEHVVANVRAQSYGENSLDITGPCALGRAFNRFFDMPDKTPLPVGASVLNSYRMRLYTFYGGTMEQRRIVDTAHGDRLIIACKFKGYMQTMYADRGASYWSHMYYSRNVFW
jgi:hypothetical protein